MKLGIMQPYFFPYLGYFDLIRSVDRWIAFDTAQYIRHGWVNRNRILHPAQGAQYIIVPIVKHDLETPIRDIVINNATDWRDRILGQLQHYRKQAPFFGPTVSLVRDCLESERESLAQLNVNSLERVCAHLGISFRHSTFSDMGLTLGPIDGPGDWALRIAQAAGAAEYVNAPGGVDLFDPVKFEAASIRLAFRPLLDFRYPTGRYGFEPGLSIIDVMMWNAPQDIRAYLEGGKA